MASNTQTSDDGTILQTKGLPQMPAFPSGDDVYDGIMSGIEPELTTSQLPLLSEKYENETLEEASKRGARYTAAFADYDKKFAAFSVQIETSVHEYQKHAFASVEEHSKMEEAKDLTNLEKNIADA